MPKPELLVAAIEALRHACAVAEILAKTEPVAARQVLTLAMRDVLKTLAG